MRATAIGAAAGGGLGAVIAVALSEAFPSSSFYPGLLRAAFGVCVATALGAVQGLISSRWSVLAKRGPRALLAIGGGCAAFISLLLSRAWTMWVALSVFGAAPAGRLALASLPVSQAITGAILGALARGAAGRRAPSRGPPRAPFQR
jgi:hypothetical protein